MKLPNKILICGIEHKVVLDPGHCGASYDEGTKTIEVGTQYPDDVFENFLHEVVEATLALRDMRYALEREELSNYDYMFAFGHKEFEHFVKDLSCSLKGMLSK